jgi:hypothetical protein
MGREIVFMDDAMMPIVYKVGVKKAETSSEKQHVIYSSKCEKNRIQIDAIATDLNAAGTLTRVQYKLTLNKEGDLTSGMTFENPHSNGYQGVYCKRIENESLSAANNLR